MVAARYVGCTGVSTGVSATTTNSSRSTETRHHSWRKRLHSQGQRDRICGLPFVPSQAILVDPHVLGSRNPLALNDGVYGISVDWPRPPNFQQPLHYRSLPWSVDGSPSSHHVYTARKAAPKTSFCCSFHRSIPAALGRLSSKAKPERRLMKSQAARPACTSPRSHTAA
jgi:hypothetical protein